MQRVLVGMLATAFFAGCAPAPILVSQEPATPDKIADAPAALRASDAALRATDQPGRRDGPWIGAAGESDYILPGTSDTILGVWVDVPSASRRAHAPTDVALVIDTSGSMAGPKIENARAAARDLVEKLTDGDIVSIQTFSDSVEERVAPTVLGPATRPGILRVIAGLGPTGGTNMFDGLRAAEGRALSSPPTYPVRRVVMISDGMANIGPSTPEVLGAVAARGAEEGVQVTAIGVGLDYDEHTLDALAMRSSGRLYHVDDPREMPAMIDREVSLLEATAATGAVVEVVPAPGVQILGADGLRVDRKANGAVEVPIGTMFGGQHREMALRVRVTTVGDGARPLASVRLHFHDPADGNLARVQEVVARYEVTQDEAVVGAHVSAKTRTILATQEAASMTLAAAQQVNDGRFDAADKQLATAEAKLKDVAARASTEEDRKRALATAKQLSSARVAARAAAAAPPAAAPAAKRAPALNLNHAAMDSMGY
jgi:Ca-activated chloride channel family protein